MVGISLQDQIIPFMSPDFMIKSIFIFISRFFGDYLEKRIVSARIDKVPVVLFSSFPQLFYPLMTRQFFCDFHEKSEDFCVS